MRTPLVSVICTCYNHANYVGSAIRSVLNQTYPDIQLIVVDNGSTDQSEQVINEMAARDSHIQFISNEQNLGINKAFNQALEETSGAYIIDLSGDDILLPGRIEEGVNKLKSGGPDFGIHFCDADFINEHDEIVGHHRTANYFSSGSVPVGNLYSRILSKYFICPPTLMYTSRAVKELNGYDPDLSYEDFDFLVRASRQFKFCYSNKVLVRRRLLQSARSVLQYDRKSKMPASTYRVCKKAYDLNRTKEEMRALRTRIWFEGRKSLLAGMLSVAHGYLKLMMKLQWDIIRK